MDNIKELLEDVVSYHSALGNYLVLEVLSIKCAMCSYCWARYLCKECAAEIALGENYLPIDNEKCKNQTMYELCIREFLCFIEESDVSILADNFKNFLRYR